MSDGEPLAPFLDSRKMLIGRARERARIDSLLLAARDGRSGALLLAGEAGIGKAALLEHARAEADAAGMLVLRARGLQSESDIPFAGLSELLSPLLDRLDAIPPAQAARCGARWRSARPPPTSATQCRPGCSACWPEWPRSGPCWR
jgi:predicted ATPase